MLKVCTFFPLLAGAVLLTGCGNAEQPKKADAPPAEKGIFISASDCADSGKLSAELCGKAIDMAVASHEKNAPTYKSLRLCVAAEGPDRCDKAVDGQYRARLQAFMVIMSEVPTGVPLYPASGKGIAGFKTNGKTVIDARDETYIVSSNAMTVANENAKLEGVAAATNNGI